MASAVTPVRNCRPGNHTLGTLLAKSSVRRTQGCRRTEQTEIVQRLDDWQLGSATRTMDRRGQERKEVVDVDHVRSKLTNAALHLARMLNRIHALQRCRAGPDRPRDGIIALLPKIDGVSHPRQQSGLGLHNGIFSAGVFVRVVND